MSNRRKKAFIASSSQPSSSFAFNDRPREIDNHEMIADVYLFTKKLDGFGAVLPDSEEYHHWALVFYFRDDNSWRTVEGFQNEDRRIYPSYTKERQKKKGKSRILEPITISPAQLRDLVYENPSNDKEYNITKENCQEWIKNFAQQLDNALGDVHMVYQLTNFRSAKELSIKEKITAPSRGMANTSFKFSKYKCWPTRSKI